MESAVEHATANEAEKRLGNCLVIALEELMEDLGTTYHERTTLEKAQIAEMARKAMERAMQELG